VLIRRGCTFDESVESVKLYSGRIDELSRKCANHLIVRLEDSDGRLPLTVSNVLDFARNAEFARIVAECCNT